jgi:hypothetical protein
MLTLYEILSQGTAERRTIGRTIINRHALLFFAGQSGVHGCSVRDITRQGAGLRLNGLNMVPLDFDFSLDNFHSVRRCRLIWRDGDFVGVALRS